MVRSIRGVNRSFVARAAAAIGGTLAAVAHASPPSGSANNRLVFADEFNGTAVDTSKWAIASPSWTMPNSVSTDTAADVSEGGGYLTLSANRTGASAFDSGSVSTYGKYNFAGGYIEARIQLPSTPGSWPAFWGLYSGWPPEADIMEYPLTTNGGTSGLLATQYNTNYHYSTGTGNTAGAGPVTTSASLAGTWHTFGMDWVTSTSVAFYLDGTQVNSYTGSSVAQMASMYTILDYAVGGWPGTPSTSQWAIGHSDQVNVDWVHVYQANTNADAPTVWTVNGGGSFTNGASWSLGVPKYENELAVFNTASASPATTAAVTLGAWQMLGGLTFNGSGSGSTTAYTIGTSASNIQLSSTTSATVRALAGSTANQAVNANVELWSNTTFENDMAGGQTLAANGQLSGTGTLTAIGVGTTVLSGSNTYTGGTVIGTGGGASVLRVTNGAALGTGAVTLDLTGNGSTARLELAGGITVPNNITFPARSTATVGIESVSGNNGLAGTITTAAGGSVYLIQSDAGMLTLSGAASGATVAGVALQAGSGARTFTLQGTGNGAVTGLVQNGGGTVSVSKAGTGTWTLGSANTYTGDTTVLAGRLVLAHASATSTASLNVSAGATLSTVGALTTSGVLRSAGTLDLTDGAIATLSAGTLSLTSATLNLQLGNGTSSDRIASTGAATLSGVTTVNLSAATGQSITPGSAYTIVTAASGLTAANFALGTKPASLNFTQFALTTPTAGSLVATAAGNPTPTTAYWTDAGSAATGDATNSWGAGAAVNTSNWSTDAAGTVDAKQLPGSITNVVLNAANAPAASATTTTQLDAAYNIAGLTFNVGAATVTSAVLNTNGNALSTGAGGVTLAATSNASATVSGTGAVQLASAQTWANQNSAASLTVATGITAMSGPAMLTFNGTGTGGVKLTGVLADGGGQLSTTFNQAGTTLLSAANTYTGTTTVAGGTVEIASTGSVAGNVTVTGGTLRLTDSPNALATNATVNVQAGGTLDVRSATAGTAATANLGAITGGGTVTRSDAGTSTLSVGATGLSATFSGSIQNGGGTLALVKSGAGTLTLAGSSSFTGGTTIAASGGSVLVTNGSALGSGPVTIGQGSINESGELQVAGNISVGGVTTVNLAGRAASNANGAPHVENVGGNNTVSANLNIGNNAGGNAANILATGGALTLTGNLSSTGLTAAAGFDLYGAGTGLVSGVVSNGTAGTTFVQKDGTGTWTLAANNTYAGGTTLNGGTLNVTGNNAWGGGVLTVNDGTADLTANNTFTGGTVITGTATGGATNTGGRVVMASTGALGAAGASVTMSGNSTLEIDTDGGDNAYALHVGTTNTINLVSGVLTGLAGINHALASLAIGNSDTVNVTAAAMVTGGSPSITIPAVTLSSGFGAGSTTFNPTTASLTLGTVNTSTAGAKNLILAGTATGNVVNGTVSNNAAVVSVEKSSTSAWTLSASNSYTGGTTIDDGGGTLLVTNRSALGTGAVTIGNGGSNASGELAISGGIALTGVPSIAIAGRNLSTAGGTATIENVSGNNTVSAPITLNGFGGNAVNVLSTAGALTLSGNLTMATVTGSRGFNFYGAGNGTVSGVISNGSATGFVQVAGTGTWTLSGANTFSGGTTVAGGTLVVANAAAVGTGAVTISGGTLAGSGTLSNIGTITVASGGTLSAGSGSTPADTIGTLSTGPQAWSSGGTLAAKVASTDGVSVTSNDTLVMSSLTVSAASGQTFTVSVPLTSATATPQVAPGTPVVLANDTESATANAFGPSKAAATLAALTLSAPAIYAPAGYQLSLATQPDTLGNGGYDLVLAAVTATPEPTSLALLSLAVAAPLGRRRRRR